MTVSPIPPTPPVEWLHYPIWPRHGLVSIYGAGSTGKSGIIASELAARFTTGAFQPVTDYTRASAQYRPAELPFLAQLPPSHRVAPGTCQPGNVFWFGGDPHTTAHADVERAGGDTSRLFPLDLDDVKERPDAYRGGLLVLDAPQGQFPDENSNSVMREFVEDYGHLADGRFLMLWGLHSGKPNPNDYRLLDINHLRGASAIAQLMRLAIELAIAQDGQPWAGITKSNIGPGEGELAWHYSKLNADYRFLGEFQSWPEPVGKVRAYGTDNDAADKAFLDKATELWNRNRGRYTDDHIVGELGEHQALCRGLLSERAHKAAVTRCGFRVQHRGRRPAFLIWSAA